MSLGAENNAGNPDRWPGAGGPVDYPELGSWASVRLVASREIETRLGSKVFRISTGVLLLLVVGLVVIAQFATGGESSTKVGIPRQDAALAAPLTAAADSFDVDVSVVDIAQHMGRTP